MDLKKMKYEADISRYLYAKAGRQRIPLSGTFELTPICNFSCKMCYVRKSAEEVKQSGRQMLSVEQWLEIAREMKDAGMLYLLLTGGEPFLYPGFWELYEQLSKMGFMISINTNGSMIDDAVIKRLKKNCPTRINLTLYGASEETYEALCGVKGVFGKVDQAICEIQKAKIPIKLNCSLTPHNVQDLEKIVNYAAEKEILLSATTYMFPPLRRDASKVGANERFTPYEAAFYNLKRYRLQFGEELYESHLKHLAEGLADPLGLEETCMEYDDGKIRCKAGNASYWVTWDGLMTPCGMLEHPNADITRMAPMDGFRSLNHQCDNLTLSGVCKGCRIQQICQVCAAVAMTETGTFSGVPKYLCENMAAVRALAGEELKKRNRQNIEK